MFTISHKPIIKVSFNEGAQEESVYLIKRLIEKLIMDQLELTPYMKGALLIHNKDNLEE